MISDDEETEWTFCYDAAGMRTQRSDRETTYAYIYDGDLLSQMTVGENILRFTYDANGAPLTLIYNGTTYFYVTNLQGDVISIRDSEGTIEAIYTYDAWGNILSVSGSSTLAALNPLRYRGYVYDIETNLYYLQSRYYNPAWGRFISADSLDVLTATPMGLTDKNLFAYCDNNPILREDCDGAFWDTVFDIVSLVVSIVEVIQDPTDSTAWLGLAGDVIDLIPGVTGVGEATRATTTTLSVVDNVYDASRMVANTGDVIDTTGDVARKIDFYGTSDGVVIPARVDEFNSNLSKLDVQNGKYVGADSNGAIRIRIEDAHNCNPTFTGPKNTFHTVPHFHIDRRLNGTSGRWVKTFTGPMEMFY